MLPLFFNVTILTFIEHNFAGLKNALLNGGQRQGRGPRGRPPALLPFSLAALLGHNACRPATFLLWGMPLASPPASPVGLPR